MCIGKSQVSVKLHRGDKVHVHSIEATSTCTMKPVAEVLLCHDCEMREGSPLP